MKLVCNRRQFSNRSPLTPRQAFTLIELLVVIAIIAILFSLTSAAVIKVIAVADETANRTDLGKLEAAVESFKTTMKAPYLPSRIRLKETGSYTLTDRLDNDSITFLKQVWPNLTFPVDWNGDGNIGGDWELEGDQCLVFFLGGIPGQSSVAATGFSTNSRNPAWHVSSGGDVIQPFYEFKSSRLVRVHNNRFYSYLDNYGRADGGGGLIRGKPIAYFSSRGNNDYYRYQLAPTGVSDCAFLGVTPYHEPISGGVPNPQRRFHNSNGVQIISAGLDANFGPGGGWSPAGAAGIAQPGRDDMANFYDRKLGVSQ